MRKEVLIFLQLSVLCHAFNYCSISRTNTLCRYKPTTFGPKCERGRSIKITEVDKANIVAMHNNLRRKIAKGEERRGRPGPQPPAANMRKLTWDDELATMAQAWANQCTFQHDANRNVKRFPVGQNLYMTMKSRPARNPDWEAAILKSWYNDEVIHMHKGYVRSFPGASPGVIGHYAAVVWADTSKVGCAATEFYNRGQPSMPHQVIYVCNYGKGENLIGAPVYRIGRAASACPKGSFPSDGLCA